VFFLIFLEDLNLYCDTKVSHVGLLNYGIRKKTANALTSPFKKQYRKAVNIPCNKEKHTI